jgi:hypothetical protein
MEEPVIICDTCHQYVAVADGEHYTLRGLALFECTACKAKREAKRKAK